MITFGFAVVAEDGDDGEGWRVVMRRASIEEWG
jgi:hypothetical protein